MSKLVDIVRKSFSDILLVSGFVVPMFFYGCKKPDPEPVPSTCSIQLKSNTSGDSPLSVSLNTSSVSGDDPIVGYRLHVDDKVSSLKHSVIDTAIILYAGSHKVFAEAVTSSGTSVFSSNYNINVNRVDGPNKEWYLLPFIPLPKGPLNFFVSRDNTAAALEYNAVSDRVHRDALIASRVDANWLSHFAPSIKPPFTCDNYMTGALVASIASLGDKLYFNNGDFKLFDWYSGSDPDSTRFHGGTFNGAGGMGLPMVELILISPNGGHGMNAIFSGDKLSVESANNIEFQYNATNVRSGQYYLEKNCTATYSYPYSYTTTANGVTKNNLTELPVMIVDYVDGIATNVRYNPNVELVKTRNGN